MNATNQIIIRTRKDGKFDFDIVAAENGNVLCGSDQGYENQADAIDMAHRVREGAYDPVITFNTAGGPQ